MNLLFSFRRCPYAMRARMALYYSGVDFKIWEVNLRDKPAELLEYSKKATVPVLVLNKGQENQQVIDESVDVIYYALQQNDPDNWLDEQLYEQTKELIKLNDTEFNKAVTRFKYHQRYLELSYEDHKAHSIKYLEHFEQLIAKNGFLVSSKLNMADIVIFPFVRQWKRASEEEFAKLEMPNLKKWLDDIMSKDFYKQALAKEPNNLL